MEVRVAAAADLWALADLLLRFDEGEQPTSDGSVFAADLLRWWEGHRSSHLPFLAVLPSGTAVGMAWLAIAARVPRPGRQRRLCGDVQSVYVVPEHRSAGIGSALVAAVQRHADGLGLEHVTVHANESARTLYEDAGFAATRDLMMWPRGAQ